MPLRTEVLTALWGVLRLAHFDDRGRRVLGTEPEDAWRSFLAPVLFLPFYLLWSLFHGLTAPDDVPFALALLYELPVYAGGWLVFPVIMWHVAQAIERENRYAHFLVAYNWSALVQNAMFFVLDAALSLAGAPPGARAFFGFLLFLYILAYAWFVARTTLGVAGGVAAMVIVVDLLVTAVWEGFASRLVGG